MHLQRIVVFESTLTSTRRFGVAGRRERGELEGEVLAQLWSVNDAQTPADVRGAIGDDLAYSTVMTILVRLNQKGLVEREKRGRAYAYQPAVAEADLTATRMLRSLQRTGDRRAALSRFVGSLPPTDVEALRSALKRARR